MKKWYLGILIISGIILGFPSQLFAADPVWTTEISNDSNERIVYYPTLYDIDDNNTLETIIVGQNKTWVLKHDGEIITSVNTGANLIYKDVDKKFKGAPAIGDIDNDNINEFIVGGRGQLVKFDFGPTGITPNIITNGIPAATINMVVLANIDKTNDRNEIIFSAYNKSESGVYVGTLSGSTFTELWSVTVNLGNVSDIPVVGDIDGDTELEIITFLPSTRNTHPTDNIIIFGPTGVIENRILISPNYKVESKVLANLDGSDNDLELGYKDYYNGTTRLHFKHHDGTNVSGWPYSKTDMFETSEPIVIVDLDKDANLDVITWGLNYSSESNITVLEKTGTEKWRKDSLAGDVSFASPVIANLMGDSNLDLLMPLGKNINRTPQYTDHELLRLSHDNTVSNVDFKFALDQLEFGHAVVVGDVDYTSPNIEIIAVNSDKGSIKQVKMFQVDLDDGFDSESLYYRRYKYNYGRTGEYADTIDTTAPYKPTIKIDTTGKSGAYMDNTSDWPFSWTVYDNESTVVGSQYSVGTSAGGSEVISWAASAQTTEIKSPGINMSAPKTALLDGTKYYINLKAKNGLDLWSYYDSVAVTLDASIPIYAPNISFPDKITSLTSITVNFVEATDAHSGILKYKIKVIKDESGTTTNITGTALEFAAPTDNVVINLSGGTTLEDGKEYRLEMTAVNGAGLETTVTTQKFAVDSSPPVMMEGSTFKDPYHIKATKFSPDYIATTNIITVYWPPAEEPHSTLTSYNIRLFPSTTQVVVSQNILPTSSTTHTFDGLDLDVGVTYNFAVRARNNAFLWSDWVTSDGFIVDLTPPIAPTSIDDGEFQNTSNIDIEWGASIDEESGIATYNIYLTTKNVTIDKNDPSTYKEMFSIENEGVLSKKLNLTHKLTENTDYIIGIEGQNKAGLYSELTTSNAFKADGTPPVVTMQGDDKEYMKATDGQITASWSATEALGGITQYEYSLVGSDKQTAVPGSTTVVDTTESSYEVLIQGLTLTNGDKYYPRVRANNQANIWSNYQLSDGVTADGTIPVMSTPVTLNNGVAYSSSNNLIKYKFNPQDNESGISHYKVEITTGNSGSDNAWHNISGSFVEYIESVEYNHVFALPFIPVDGTQLYTRITLKNNAELESDPYFSNPVIIDTTAPTVTTVIDAEYTTTDNIVTSWTATEPHSSIVSYKVTIIDTSNSDSVVTSKNISGSTTSTTFTGLALIHNHKYAVRVTATNIAGLTSSSKDSDGVVADDTAVDVMPANIVMDSNNYTSHTDKVRQLNFSDAADEQSGVKQYEVVLLEPDETTTINTWIIPLSETKPMDLQLDSGKVLTHNTTYNIKIRAENNLGISSNYTSATSFLVDTSIPSIVIDGDGSTHTEPKIGIQWLSNDAESGIDYYQYAVGTVEKTPNYRDWQTTTSMKVTFNLVEDNFTNNTKFYFGVRAYNNAGLISNEVDGWTDGVTIILSGEHDTSPPDPPTPRVLADETLKNDKYVTNPSEIKFGWTNSDPESSIVSASYQLLDENGSVLNSGGGWTDLPSVDELTASSLNLENGGNYTVKVKVKNQGGKETITTKNIIVETTPPVLEQLDGTGYYSSISDLPISFTSEDPESGISSCSYRIETEDGSLIKDWTNVVSTKSFDIAGLNLEHNKKYVVKMKVANGASFESTESSFPISIDTTKPEGLTALDSGKYTASKDNLSINLNASDQESGILEYEYTLLKNGIEVPNSTQTTTNTNISLSGLELEHNTDYSFKVRAKNKAGTWSELGQTDGIKVDLEPPTVPVVSDQKEYLIIKEDAKPVISWASSDLESGISDYKLSIGKKQGDDDVMPWTSVGTQTTITINEILILPDGNKYYFGFDSQSIKVSKSNINKNKVNKMKVQEVTLTEVALEPGETYFYSVKSLNGAGEWSTAGVSDGLTILSSSPKVTSIKFNQKDIIDGHFFIGAVSVNVTVMNNPFTSTYELNIKESDTDKTIKTFSGTAEGNRVISHTLPILKNEEKYKAQMILTDTSGYKSELVSASFVYYQSSDFYLDKSWPYPNPFNPNIETSKISFQIGTPSTVTVYVHSLSGELVFTKEVDKEYGNQEIIWDGTDLMGDIVGNGIYLAYIIAKDKNTGDTAQDVVKIAVIK